MTHSSEGFTGNPSRLHECAVGLIWEVLTHGEHEGYSSASPHAKPRDVWVRDDDGVLHNLAKRFGSVTIPTALQPIQGVVPDLAILDDDGTVVTIVEVVVTAPPNNRKRRILSQIAKQGVNVVIRTVSGWKDISRLIEPSYKTDISWGMRRSIESDITARRYRASRGINVVVELIEGLKATTPEYRREFLDVLRKLDTPEAVCAFHEDNPKCG